MNILLVDDNRNLLTTLSNRLRKAVGKAISVAVCFNGFQAPSMLVQFIRVLIRDGSENAPRILIPKKATARMP